MNSYYVIWDIRGGRGSATVIAASKKSAIEKAKKLFGVKHLKEVGAKNFVAIKS
jgi:hypothetical protein